MKGEGFDWCVSALNPLRCHYPKMMLTFISIYTALDLVLGQYISRSDRVSPIKAFK